MGVLGCLVSAPQPGREKGRPLGCSRKDQCLSTLPRARWPRTETSRRCRACSASPPASSSGGSPRGCGGDSALRALPLSARGSRTVQSQPCSRLSGPPTVSPAPGYRGPWSGGRMAAHLCPPLSSGPCLSQHLQTGSPEGGSLSQGPWNTAGADTVLTAQGC